MQLIRRSCLNPQVHQIWKPLLTERLDSATVNKDCPYEQGARERNEGMMRSVKETLYKSYINI